MDGDESAGTHAGPSRRLRIALLAVLAAGLLLRVGWLAYARPAPLWDFQDYRSLAGDILDHQQFGYPDPTAQRAPGYPFFLACLMAISRSTFWLSLANVLLSAAICWLVYLFGRSVLRSPVAAVAAAAACAFNPTFVMHSPVLATEHLFVPLLLVCSLVALKSPRLALAASVSGALLGLGILVRGEGLFLAPAVAAVLWVRGRGRGLPWVRAAVPPLLAAALTVATISPWWVRNRRVLGPRAGLGTNGGATFHQGHNPVGYGCRNYPNWEWKTYPNGSWYEDFPELDDPADEVGCQQECYRRAAAYIASRPASLAESALLGTIGLYRPSAYGVGHSYKWQAGREGGGGLVGRLLSGVAVAGWVLLVVLALLSLGAGGLWTRLAARLAAGLLLLNWAGYALLFYGHPRYRFFAEVVLCLPAGIGLVRLGRWLRRRGGSAGGLQPAPPCGAAR